MMHGQQNVKHLNAVFCMSIVWFNNKEESLFVFRNLFVLYGAKHKQRLHLWTRLSVFVREMHCVCCEVGS